MECEYCQDLKFLAHIENEYLSLHDKRVVYSKDTIFVVPCRYCRKEFVSHSQVLIPSVYENCTFDSYDITSHFVTDSQKFVHMKLREYCKERRTHGFLLVGTQGVGKSHLVVSTLKELSKQKKPSVFLSEERLVERLRSLSRNYQKDGSILKMFSNVEIIAISRLGIASSSWDRSLVSSFISLAYEEQKWILYGISPYSDTTKPSLEERIELGTVGKVGIYSRLRALCPQVYTVLGQDYRHHY